VAASRCLATRVPVPWAGLSARPLQEAEVAALRCLATRVLVPWTALSAGPPQQVEVASACGLAAGFPAPRDIQGRVGPLERCEPPVGSQPGFFIFNVGGHWLLGPCCEKPPATTQSQATNRTRPEAKPKGKGRPCFSPSQSRSFCSFFPLDEAKESKSKAVSLEEQGGMPGKGRQVVGPQQQAQPLTPPFAQKTFATSTPQPTKAQQGGVERSKGLEQGVAQGVEQGVGWPPAATSPFAPKNSSREHTSLPTTTKKTRPATAASKGLSQGVEPR
jgi:hypothetical protein